MSTTTLNPLESAPEMPTTPIQNWRSLLLLCGYRWLISIFLTATYFSGRGDSFFGPYLDPSEFELACIAYLLLCIPMSIPVLLRRPRISIQLYTYAVIDVLALTFLTYAAGGVTTGLGLLLITPVAGTSILLPRRLGILIGAMAALALLGQEAWRYLTTGSEQTSFVQSGMLGVIYLFAAWAANTLSSRARESEALASERKIALDNLAHINESIIAHIRNGVLVIDAKGNIRLLNQAARELLGMRPGIGKKLAMELPELAGSLEAWRLRPQVPGESITTEVADRVLLAHFNRLGSEVDSPTLIFIEDASRTGEQAQQMKLAALGRLTASIAHEIRNPLGAISHAGQLLAENLPARHRIIGYSTSFAATLRESTPSSKKCSVFHDEGRRMRKPCVCAPGWKHSSTSIVNRSQKLACASIMKWFRLQ